MREIVFDTETTGLDPANDRVIEIGCVELVNHIPNGRVFHRFVNPGRPMSVGAFDVHGLSDEFLKDKPPFAAIADEFAEFIDGAVLIAHNAEFDVAFVNAEFARLNRPGLDVFRVIDTLGLARRKHPGGPNSLDGLCNRYGVDLSQRTLHGALLDSNLLAEVYIELIGGRQASLLLETAGSISTGMPLGLRPAKVILRPEPRPFFITDIELGAHRDLIAKLDGSPIWKSYLPLAAE